MTGRTDARPSEPTPRDRGYVIWRAWRDGMLEQGRHVAPERMAWETLTDEDKALDARIEAEALQPAQPVTDDSLEDVLAAALAEFEHGGLPLPDNCNPGTHERTAAMLLATPSGSRLRSAGTGERSESRCDRCGGVNPVWHAPHDLWNAAVRTDGADEWPFLCPSCFATVAEERGVVSDRTVWALVPDADLRSAGAERDALVRHVIALTELCELVTRHEDSTECGCGTFDDWFQTWDGPRLATPDDIAAAALSGRGGEG